MLNLAAFRYRNILAEAGGPIERVEMGETVVLGERLHLANAYLIPALAGNRDLSAVYSRANGSGTASSPMIARFKAISEAMERWAHWEIQSKAVGGEFGFAIDPSSNGFSAFPGVWRRQARQGALEEAVERFNLLNWWEGRLPAQESATRWPDIRAVVVKSRAPGLLVILFKRTLEGFFAYGHAGAMDFESACQKAAAEMERHSQVVARFTRLHGSPALSHLPPNAHPIERRSLFFAGEEGHRLFLERLRTPVPDTAELKWAFDGPVPGPWTKYADVWRVLFEPPSRRFLSTDHTYFML